MKRLALLMLLLLTLTACTPVNVPPADYDTPSETSAPESETASETVTETESATEPPTTARPAETQPAGSTDSGKEETETTTEPLEIPAWAEDYAALIRRQNADSEHNDAAYALIRLDADEIPELVLFDDLTMQVYYYADNAPALLLEDSYKSTAISGQNLCYQPETGNLASYFSTMGGGSGFNLFFYEKLDPRNVTRCCFNSIEAEGGEMPYNSLWDRAEEYDISCGEDFQVTLGKSWIHIGEGFADIHKLVPVTGNKLTLEWNNILADVHAPDALHGGEDETEN